MIVESAAKVPKIKEVLGDDYTVLPCFGHVQDVKASLDWLPEHESSGFDPDTIPYVLSKGATAQRARKALRFAAPRANRIIIASDMDREGEAIGYHLCEVLKVKKLKVPVERIIFDQITPDAIQAAMDQPTTLREPLYRAQQARRVVDMLFGFTVSPYLWPMGQRLSAGRCQSPALRWMWERQAAFQKAGEESKVPKRDVVARLAHVQGAGDDDQDGTSVLVCKYNRGGRGAEEAEQVDEQDEDGSPSAESPSEEDTDEHILEALSKVSHWVVNEASDIDTTQSPPTPLTTAALQRKVSSKMGWQPKRVMSVAQSLYDSGYITYMRTDSTNLAPSFKAEARAYIQSKFGPEYVGDDDRGAETASETKGNKKKKKGKKGKDEAAQLHAQEAHEAVRPVFADMPELSAEQSKNMAAGARELYKFIYRTTFSSLMSPCVMRKSKLALGPRPGTTKDEAGDTDAALRGEVSAMRFPGHRAWEVNPERFPFEAEETMVSVGDEFKATAYEARERYPLKDRPYTAADMISLMEKEGIGRPSTYSNILQTLEMRAYASATPKWADILQNSPWLDRKDRTVTVNMKGKKPRWTEKSEARNLASTLKGRYHVTDLGSEVMSYLTSNLGDMINSEFTKQLEKDLDLIARGELTYQEVVGGFYDSLRKSTAGLKPASGTTQGRDGEDEDGRIRFSRGHRIRYLEMTEDTTTAVLVTKHGPCVAVWQNDSKKSKENRYYNLDENTDLDKVSLEQAKEVIAKAQKDIRGKLVGQTQDGQDIVAKKGPYGIYFQWIEAGQRQTASLRPTNSEGMTTSEFFAAKKELDAKALQDVTEEEALAAVKSISIVLHKPHPTYMIKRNWKSGVIFLERAMSKKRPGQKRKVFTTVLQGYSMDDLDAIQRLTKEDCDKFMHETMEKINNLPRLS